MSSLTLVNQPDPFEEILEVLRKVSQSVSELQPPINDTYEIVVTVDGVLTDLDKLPGILKGLEELLKGIQVILDILDTVPIVDVIAGFASQIELTAQNLLSTATTAFGNIDSSIVKPCRAAFDDLSKGLIKVQDIIHTISQTVPDYLNTLQILNFMAEIAQPLVEILKGSEPADKLESLLTAFKNIKDQVGRELAPLKVFIDSVSEVVHSISNSLSSVFNSLASTMEMVQADLHWVEEHLSPVEHAFTRVVDTIKPIHWALDAISWIFDHVCKPIIDKILEATGLQHLLDALQEKIEEKLGIKPILDMVENNLKSDTASNWTQQGGSEMAKNGQQAWSSVSTILGQYNTRDNTSIQNEINLLISIVTRTPVDPDKPSLIPDWPQQPELPVHDSDHAPELLVMASVPNQPQARKITTLSLSQSVRYRRLQRSSQALAAISSNETLSPLFSAATVLLEVAPLEDESAISQVKTIADTAHQKLSETVHVGPRLVDNLKAYDAVRMLPADFYCTMNDLVNLFQDCISCLTFLEQFGVIKNLIEDFKSPLSSQVVAIQKILDSCNLLQESGSRVDDIINQVIAAVPKPSVFKSSLTYMDAIALGANSLVGAMTQARNLDQQMNNIYKSRLDVLDGKIQKSAQAVMGQTKEVSEIAQQVLDQSEAFNNQLVSYAQALSKINNSANVISLNVLPKLSKAVNILNTLVSILDPLSGLLESLKCIDNDPTKRDAATVINTFNNSVHTSVSIQEQILRKLLNEAIPYLIHTNTISENIQEFTQLVEKEHDTFKAATEELSRKLPQLETAMQPKQKFNAIDRQNQSIIIDNFFVDQDFAKEASVLFSDIQQAAEQSGLIPHEVAH